MFHNGGGKCSSPRWTKNPEGNHVEKPIQAPERGASHASLAWCFSVSSGGLSWLERYGVRCRSSLQGFAAAGATVRVDRLLRWRERCLQLGQQSRHKRCYPTCGHVQRRGYAPRLGGERRRRILLSAEPDDQLRRLPRSSLRLSSGTRFYNLYPDPGGASYEHRPH